MGDMSGCFTAAVEINAEKLDIENDVLAEKLQFLE
jgi:hypothetical protein